MIDTYTDTLLEWRHTLDEQLRAEDGWLALIGLIWLGEGEHTIGSAADCTIVLPADSAPPLAATLLRNATQVLLRPAAAAQVLVNGSPISDERMVHTDRDETPDVVQIGRIGLTLIGRGERIGARLRDPQNPARLNFTGRVWFPIEANYRFRARFEAHSERRLIGYQDMLGDSHEDVSVGRVHFTLDDQDYSLEAFDGGAGQLRFVFRDATAGQETYGAARFLRADAPQDGWVDLDFNRAYNPPCAFSEYTTCPLPPRENILPVRIEAGERL